MNGRQVAQAHCKPDDVQPAMILMAMANASLQHHISRLQADLKGWTPMTGCLACWHAIDQSLLYVAAQRASSNDAVHDRSGVSKPWELALWLG